MCVEIALGGYREIRGCYNSKQILHHYTSMIIFNNMTYTVIGYTCITKAIRKRCFNVDTTLQNHSIYKIIEIRMLFQHAKPTNFQRGKISWRIHVDIYNVVKRHDLNSTVTFQRWYKVLCLLGFLFTTLHLKNQIAAYE